MTTRIRPATPTEYPHLGTLVADTYLTEGYLDFGPDDPYLPVLKDVAARAAHAEILVAEAPDGLTDLPDGIAGTVTFVPRGATPMADIATGDEAEIRMLAVAPKARGHGIGEALVRACVTRAAGAHRIVLSTQSEMHAAHRLYERLGFVRTPHRDWSPVPHLDDLTLLTYELTL
ncbi:GNAT family N-acetyltransferase [Streptomyces sp. NPDC093252]|uniref:GNAT family N-acetyltransferase n=1 Tax=Streptomyces sp. NPDC093252 TaxID=3154980 RepID=UPI003425BC8A